MDSLKIFLTRILMIVTFISIIFTSMQFTELFRVKTVEKLASDYIKTVTGGYINVNEYNAFCYTIADWGFSAEVRVYRNDLNKPVVKMENSEAEEANILAGEVVYKGQKVVPLNDKDMVVVILKRDNTLIRKDVIIHGKGVLE